MIKISKPKVVLSEDNAKMVWHVSIDAEESSVWLAVSPEYKEYLCTDRNDGIVIGILNYAMRYNHDIYSEAPLTDDLFFNLDNYLIDALANENKHFHRTLIKSPLITAIKSGTAVATGISLGVDSLHSFHTFYKYKIDKFALTHLLYNNVGSHGISEKAQCLFKTRIASPTKFADEVGLKLIVINTNLQDVFKQNHYKSHTYVNMFPVYSLQKLFSTYYYASAGYSYNEFSLKDKFCPGTYEIWSLPLFSTPFLRIYGAGEAVDRMDKLNAIVDNVYAQRYLNVCVEGEKNCGVCEKCVRTMLELDALGSLDKFGNVFDIDYYKQHRDWYMSQMMFHYYNGDHDYKRIYELLKDDLSKRIKAKEYLKKIYIYIYRIGSRIKSKMLHKL
jgi:hypothetical protein